MPTKLKTPITLTIETVEDAISIWHRLNIGSSLIDMAYRNKFSNSPMMAPADQWQSLSSHLRQQGIEPKTWRPLLIGTHAPEFKPNGDVQVGCTLVPFDVVQTVAAKAKEAKEGGEWPKFWINEVGGVSMASNDQDPGSHWSQADSAWVQYTDRKPYVSHACEQKLRPITRTEAEQIIGRKIEG